jgi:hypothetical protein
MSVATEPSSAPEQRDAHLRLQTRRHARSFTALILVGIAAYLYINLFVFLHAPVLQGDDQVFFWTNAQRMLFGERAYLDFFQYTPPGTDLLFFAVFKLLGLHIWALNLTVLALGTTLCWICFRVASQIMERGQALLATLLYLVLIFSKPLNATHHWFSVLAVMCATLVLMHESSRPRIVGCGALLGLASFFTQTHGVAAALGLSVFLIWQQRCAKSGWRKSFAGPGLLLLSFVASLLALNAYFIATVGANRLWYEQVLYVWRYAPRVSGIANLGLPDFVTWRALPLAAQQIFVYLLLPVVYALSLLRARFKPNGSTSNSRGALLLCLVGIFLLAEVAISPNWLRIYSVSMPGIILLLWLVDHTARYRRPMITLLYCGVACLALRQTWARHHQQYVVCDLPAGHAAADPQTCDELLWITKRVKPGNFFFQAAWPGMYVPLGVRNPLFIDAVGPNEQTRPEDVDLAIRQLQERDVRYVLWSKRLDRQTPGLNSGNSLGPLRTYLHNQYGLVRTFPSEDELWERK